MITVNTDSQGAYPDASEDRIAALVDQIGDGVMFVIVERDDVKGFAQAIGKPDDYTVEFQEPSGEHWQATATTTTDVCTVLLGWAQDRPGWRDSREWTSLGNLA